MSHSKKPTLHIFALP